MPTPASNQNETSKMKKLTSGDVDQSIHARLPRGNSPVDSAPVSSQPRVVPVVSESGKKPRRYQFLPAFWTIASGLSLIVNVILIIVILLMLQMLKQIRDLRSYGVDEATNLLGGLYANFVKMDRATITSTIPVDATIPLNLIVPVKATTQIRLAENAVIRNAHVFIDTGEVRIDANATVTLPAETPLTVRLDFPLNVQDRVPVHLDVPVRIPLNQTELHEPFVGLQKVVEPWYCIIEPNATFNGLQVCSPTAQNTDPTLLDPALRDLTPVGTVIP